MRTPGYGLEADVEQVLRDHFDVANTATKTSVFQDGWFGVATDELVTMLRERGHLPDESRNSQ